MPKARAEPWSGSRDESAAVLWQECSRREHDIFVSQLKLGSLSSAMLAQIRSYYALCATNYLMELIGSEPEV